MVTQLAWAQGHKQSLLLFSEHLLCVMKVTPIPWILSLILGALPPTPSFSVLGPPAALKPGAALTSSPESQKLE